MIQLVLAFAVAVPWDAPLNANEIRVWSSQELPSAMAPRAVRRLLKFERIRQLDMEGASSLDLSDGAFDLAGSDPLNVATRFQVERLRLELGAEPREEVAELFAPVDRHRRWGISRSEEASALLLLANEFAVAGSVESALNLRRRAAVDFPRSTPELSGMNRENLLRRARNFVRDMDYEAGLALFERLLQGTKGAERVELMREIGHLMGDKMRDRYARVVALYQEVVASPQVTPEDHFYLIYAAGKIDDEVALKLYRKFVERFPDHPDRPKAAFFAAWTRFDREELEVAIVEFDLFLSEYPKSGYRFAARWYRGLARFRLGRFEEAREDFLFTARYTSKRDKGRYWVARTLLAQGEEAEAVPLLRELAGRDSFSYYGILARALLPKKVEPPTFGNFAGRLGRGLSDRRARTQVAGLPGGLRAKITEAFAAVQLGRSDLADALLAHVEVNGLKARRFEPLRRWLQARLGLVHRQIRNADARRCRRALESDPRRPSVGACWRMLYPTPHRDLVESVRGDLPSELFWAVMRQESFFLPQARSHADALGLMQVIPQVGRPAAEALGDQFAPYDLYRPATNLRYFAHAARERFDRFGGHLSLVLMSYNATPDKTWHWLQDNQDLPFDLFIEEIPWSETRDYVKKISGHLARYRTLHGAGGSLLERSGLAHPTRVAGDLFADLLQPTGS